MYYYLKTIKILKDIDASVTKEISAPEAGWTSTAEEERASLAALKESAIAADQTNGVEPLGPSPRALVRGWIILAAAAGTNRL
jgi:hypothetical protein